MKESGHEGQPPFRIETGVCITFENINLEEPIFQGSEKLQV